MSYAQKHWDIFCSVVDNYGDIGVAWRLARQLVDEHAIAVRLFVDDRNALQRIAPSDAAGVTVANSSDDVVGETISSCGVNTLEVRAAFEEVRVEKIGV